MTKTEVIILAAGQGTRMRSALPKVLHTLGGKPMLAHVADAARALGQAGLHFVVGHGADDVKDIMGSDCSYAIQAEQLGTGHAVQQALPHIDVDAKVLILYGDVPLIKTDTLQSMLDAVDDDSIAVLTCNIDDPTGYGRIVRNEHGQVTAIVEQKDASPTQCAIDEINTGIMCVPGKKLAEWLPKLSNANAQGEYYLTDIIAMAANESLHINTPQPASIYEVQGVNDRLQLAALERIYQRWRAEALMKAGVALADPSRIDIRGDVSVGRDVFIDINAVIIGENSLGNNIIIGPNCVLINATIRDGAHIHANSVIESATVGEDCQIGPFARLRPNTRLEQGVKIGNFVEVKNASFGENAKANHLAYIGDASVGDNTNIGAGTITCNYDGANKHRTTMGRDVFIGSNSTLVAPVVIDDQGFVAAGSTITQTVPEKALGVGRGRQRNIENWKRPKKPE